MELQELFNEWVVTDWQRRRHDGLRDPITGRTLTPNEMYNAMFSAAPQVPIMFGPDDYISLLPKDWRRINAYGINLQSRTYSSDALRELAHQSSGITAQDGKWEVRYDPYNLLRIWVRDPRTDTWIPADWTRARELQMPFSDFLWEQARTNALAQDGVATEDAIVAELRDLRERMLAGPGHRHERRQVARQQAIEELTESDHVVRPTTTTHTETQDENDAAPSPITGKRGVSQLGDVVPLPRFDPARED